MKQITVLIPCYNEEHGIGKVIESIPKQKLKCLGYSTRVLVIDNNSKDRTAEIALSKGAEVITEKRQGKGFAVRTGFRSISINDSIIVMLDGDDTYLAGEMLRLVEPIDSGFCQCIIGTRIAGKIKKGSMTALNLFGNKILTCLVRSAYNPRVADVCTGYFAWDRETVEKLSRVIKSKGFSLEMEMIAKMSKMGISIYSVPITYEDRKKTSTKLKPFGDGLKILTAFFKYLGWNPKKHLRKKSVFSVI